MTYLSLDKELYVLYPIFALGTASTLGLTDPAWIPIIDLSDVVITAGNIELTIGRVLSILALVAVFVNRDKSLDLDSWSTVEVWTVYATVGLVLAPPIFPALQGTLAETPWALLTFTLQGIGFGLVSYIN